MTEISVTELYALYLDTVERATSNILDLTDEEIAYNLFEEFDIGAICFLHEDSLAKLYRAGLIDAEMVAISKEVRKRWLVLEQGSRSIVAIKTWNDWKELFELCDWLKSKAQIV
jgi:hypothetical protein